ncbi:MAG: DUF6153 family protein [Formivibrio sp.]|nr:DUF6153 family protein [Formivibrio sp.]
MNAKRFLILLLMWLIPLYPVLAGAAVHHPSSVRGTMQMTQATIAQSAQDCCTTNQSGDHSLHAGSQCDAGICASHCVVSVISATPITPALIGLAHPTPFIVALSSITLEPPSRPPSLL